MSIKKTFQLRQFTYGEVSISLMESYFRKPYYGYVEEILLILLVIHWNLCNEECFYVKEKPVHLLPLSCCKEASICDLWLFAESPRLKHLYFLICDNGIYIELNWLCKHTGRIRINQDFILIYPCTGMKFLLVSIFKQALNILQ